MSTPDIDANEILYRQIGPGGNPIYFAPDKIPPVHRAVFLPSRNDTDGLSLIRSRFRTEIWSAYRVEQPAIRFRLALLQAEEMQQAALNVGFSTWSYRSTPDALDDTFGEPRAHCVVVEINRTDYEMDQNAKKRIKEWATAVANLVATQDVRGPFDAPTDSDSYRP